MRSREDTLMRDEEPTKIFLKKERQRGRGNRIGKVTRHGTIHEGDEQVQEAFTAAYRELFNVQVAASAEEMEAYVKELQRVDEGTRNLANAPITEHDIQAAIKKLSTNNAPGPDGIGSIFYKTFSSKLGRILEKVFQDIHKRGLLPPSMRKAHTVLISKKKSPRSAPEISDFHPISLLCTDYKILAKILASRLDCSLKKVIGSHQTYGIKGRSISRNLHVMRTICEAAEVWRMPLAVLQVDLSQAFDRVSHAYLFTLLKRCDVGDYLEKWITLCYKQINMHLIINGRRGSGIDIVSSVRQGCPLSPMLFSLYLEPLCRKLLGKATIKGLSLGAEEASHRLCGRLGTDMYLETAGD